MNKLNILFAEDDAQLGSTVVEVVVTKYHPDVKIVWKTDGDLAFDEFEKRKDYGLIVTDLQMPRRTGLWLAKQVKARNKDIPIVLWTGAMMPIPAHEEWMFEYVLSKDFGALFEAIDRFYKRWKGEDHV